MKKHLLSFAVMLSATLFTACMDTDGTRNTYYVPVNKGVFLVGAGNAANGIPGTMTRYSYNPKSVSNGIYGGSLGNGVLNDVICHGSNLYIVADDENSVFVIDAKTLIMKRRIDMMELMGEQGAHPRRITANKDRIYVSTYSGYVAAIDTVSFSLKDSCKVGSYPEGLVVSSNGYLYVANSDFGNGNASISVINLSTKTTEVITDENIRNPQELAVTDSYIYYLDYGQYGDAPDYKQEHAGLYRYGRNSKKTECIIPNATGMACYNYYINPYDAKPYIFTYNDGNGVEKTTYSMYDVSANSITAFEPEGIESPAAIAVDPYTGYLFIASNRKPSGSQYPDYSSNGYVNIYYVNDINIKPLDSYGCCVSPVRFAFNGAWEEYVEK